MRPGVVVSEMFQLPHETNQKRKQKRLHRNVMDECEHMRYDSGWVSEKTKIFHLHGGVCVVVTLLVTARNGRANPKTPVASTGFAQNRDLLLIALVHLFTDSKCQLLHINGSIHLHVQVGCGNSDCWPERCPDSLVVLET